MSVETFVERWTAKDAVTKYRWGWNNNKGAREFWTDFFREVYDIDFENDERITIVEVNEEVMFPERRFWLWTRKVPYHTEWFKFTFGDLTVKMDYRPQQRMEPETDAKVSCSFSMFVVRRGLESSRWFELKNLAGNLDAFEGFFVEKNKRG
jgi:hypothetical protein